MYLQKSSTLVNTTIMDFFSHFWKELPTWPDTLLKTLIVIFASDECTVSIFKVTTGSGRQQNDGMEQNMSFIQKVCVNFASHSSERVGSTSFQNTVLFNHHMV